MRMRAVTILMLLAPPAIAQASDRPMTIERQSVVMRDAIEVCRLTLEDRALHAQRSGYSYQEAVLLGSACGLIEVTRLELAAGRAVADAARALEQAGPATRSPVAVTMR